MNLHAEVLPSEQQDVSRVTFSLCYFDDAESDPMPTMLADIAWDEAKRTIQAWVKSIAE